MGCTMEAIGSFFMFFIRLPARAWSSFRARANITEEIPLIDIQSPESRQSSEIRREAILASSPIKDNPRYDRSIFKIFTVNSEYADMIHYTGLGFWTDIGNAGGVFLTAGHVLPEFGEVLLMNAMDDAKKIRIQVSDWTVMDEYDVAYMEPLQDHTSRLGISKSRAAHSRLRETIVVSAYGRNATSLGTVKPQEESIHLKYVGSSKPGFSGSPYISGRTVFGMHQGSTSEYGSGIDVGFLSLKLNKLLKVKMESTEDWLMDEIEKTHRRGGKIKWSEYGLDDVVIDIRGKDFIYSKADWYQMLEDVEGKVKNVAYQDFGQARDRYDDDTQRGRKKDRKTYRYLDEAFPESYSDIPELPKNVMTPTPVLVSGAKNVLNVQLPRNPKLSKLSPSLMEERDLIGQPSIPAVSSAALDDTLRLLLKQQQDLLNRMLQIEKRPVCAYKPQFKKKPKSGRTPPE
nr:MAG: RNA-dependent RNA polymerase [Riboviria sp.]